MEALYELVITVDRLQDDILELLGMLVLFNFMDEGRALQVAFEQLLGRVKGRSKEIWSPENTSAVSNVTVGVVKHTTPVAMVMLYRI